MVGRLGCVCLLFASACHAASGGGAADGGTDGGAGDLATTGGATDLAGAPSDLTPPPTVVHQIPGVVVSTLAGSSTAGGSDGVGAAAQFDDPVGVALDANGLLYVTEYNGNRVRTVDGGGSTHTLAIAPPSGESLTCPFAIVVVDAGELVVQTDCDAQGTKGDHTGTLWTVPLGGGMAAPIVQGLGRPRGLALLSSDLLAVSDRTTDTLMTLVLSTASSTLLAGSPNLAGDVDARGAAGRFDEPYGLGRMPDGSLVLADFANDATRQITAAGEVTTLVGAGAGMLDGPRAGAMLDQPKAVSVDAAGDVFVSDTNNHRIRRISAAGEVATVAGNGIAGFADGAGDAAQFYGQEGIAATPDGKTLYVADGNNGDGSAYHRVRKITLP